MIPTEEELGQKDETNERLHAVHYRGAAAAILVYDMTRAETYDNIVDKWLPAFYEVSPDTPIALFGNKCDLRDQVAVRFGKHLGLKKELQEKGYNVVASVRTSAKTGEGLEEGLEKLAEVLA